MFAAVLAACGVGKASGELWVYEGFQYVEDTYLKDNIADLNDPSLSKGFTTGWTSSDPGELDKIHNKGLTYGSLVTHGLSLRSYTPPSAEYEWESLSAQNRRTIDPSAFPSFADISEIWISFLVQRDGEIWTGTKPVFTDYALLTLSISGSPVVRPLMIGELEGGDRLGFEVATVGEGVPVNGGPVSLGVGETKLIVFKLTMNVGATIGGAIYELGELFVNPIIGQETPGVDPVARGEVNIPRLFTSLDFRTGNTGTDFIFDELRIGSTYADVTPVIPEPTSLLLLGTAGAALIGSRRRRK